jgi:DNA-binding transcriptional LysR family regulator
MMTTWVLLAAPTIAPALLATCHPATGPRARRIRRFRFHAELHTRELVVKYTDTVATLPSRVGTMLAHELELQLVRPPLVLPRVPIGLYWHERSHRDPANKWLRALFQRLFAESARNAGGALSLPHG